MRHHVVEVPDVELGHALEEDAGVALGEPLRIAVAFGIGALWAAGIGAALGPLGFARVFAIMAATYLVAACCVLLMRERRPAAVRR